MYMFIAQLICHAAFEFITLIYLLGKWLQLFIVNYYQMCKIKPGKTWHVVQSRKNANVDRQWLR